MSKAFTNENVDVPEQPVRRLGVPVPEPNYVTAAGLAAMRTELDELGRSAGNEDRMRELTDHLATAEVVEPGDRTQVGLGATVTVEDDDRNRSSYRIVGAFEAAPRAGAVSWQSPIANALWGARVGDSVVLPRAGGVDVEIVSIDYD